MAPREERSAAARRAFTLVEMIIVVSIILVVLGLVLPAASTLWNERRRAEAINTIRGLLMTSRADALRSDGVETGFLSYIDAEGLQHLVPIAQAQPPDPTSQVAWQHVFAVSAERDHVLPAPMRAVPRYVVVDEDDPSSQSYDVFSDEELANNDFNTLLGDRAQRHRNFFSMIFRSDGSLMVGRNVLIRDEDPQNTGIGGRTGLTLGPGAPDPATTKNFYARNNQQAPIDEIEELPMGFLVVEPGDNTIAVNFLSVDGLLVYDDSLLAGVPADKKREVLSRTALPLYVSRWTGAVVRGVVEEASAP